MPGAPELNLRIVLAEPPEGVRYCLQRRSRADCVDHATSSGGDMVFHVPVRVKPGGEAPDFLGPMVRGRPGDRHIAILIGTLAGDEGSCWTRGLKIRLLRISWAQVEAAQATPGGALQGRFIARARDGSPACATAKVAEDGAWRTVPSR